MESIQKACRQFDEEDLFYRCAAIFLPYLTPAELAYVSLSCSTLNRIAKLIADRRIYDASRAFEKVAVPFINPIVGDTQPYSYFIYSPTQLLQIDQNFRQSWGSEDERSWCNKGLRPNPFLFRVEGASGCACGDLGETCDSCTCMECGPSCSCELWCENRVTQCEVSVKLKIMKDERKGWGLYAAELIPKAKFVCEYAGEVLSTEEAKRRQKIYDQQPKITPALLVIKEHLPSGKTCLRINIDATRIGNISRFINHACDGGSLDTVILRSSGSLLPRVCFFTSRDIQENEELCFSYGSSWLGPNCSKCFCGTASCTGLLPSEHT